MEEQGQGYNVGEGIVPIIPATDIFDLSIGGAKHKRDFNFGGSVDAALIELTNGSDDATYHVFGSYKSEYNTITEVQRTRDETIGDTVCISGSQMKRVKCGTLKSTNWRGNKKGNEHIEKSFDINHCSITYNWMCN